MSAKVTPVAYGVSGGKPMGTFHARMFNMFEDKDVEEYAALRTRMADESSGTRLDTIKEHIRRITENDSDAESGTKVTTVRDDLYMFVQWWERTLVSEKGGVDVDPESALRPGPAVR